MARDVIVRFFFSIVVAFPAYCFAGQNDPPKKDFEEPGMGIRGSTSVVPNSGALVNGRLMFESVDSNGKVYSVEYDPSALRVVAVSGSNVIIKTFTPQELVVTESRASQAASVGLAPVVLVPMFMGVACYSNDQFTKHDAIRTCERAGGTVVMEDSGICGFGASYRCENVPPPSVPPPNPTPVPGPSSQYKGIWASDGSGLRAVGASDYWSVWTYDDDWF